LAGIRNVVVYVRLSKEDRRKRPISPAKQRRVCLEVARRAGWNVVGIFDRDIGISGRSFDERPDWQALLAFVRERAGGKEKVDAVLVFDWTRYGRNLEEGLATARELEALGVRLRSASDIYTAPETLEGWKTFVLQLFFADVERREIAKRTRDALAELRREGVHLGELPRFFHRDEEKRLVLSPTGLEVVRLRAAGESYGQIAKKLGITKKQAWNLCRFVAKERARLEAEGEPIDSTAEEEGAIAAQA